MKIGEPYYHSIFTGVKRRLIERQDTYQYIPLLSSLWLRLSDRSIVDEIYQCPTRIRNDGIIEDVCDGQSHPIFSNDPLALQLVLFYDELELCNPLGTHVKIRHICIHIREHSSEVSVVSESK